jgi:photosystem II stability/assembly factor-like uncharacterized protein
MKLIKIFFTLSTVLIIFFNVTILSQAIDNIISINFDSEQTATMVGEDGIIKRTVNGGTNWIVQSSNITNVLNSIDIINYVDQNADTVNLELVACENGVILKSTDHGSVWNIILSGITENLYDIVICSPNMIFVCGNNGTLLKSIDLGETWEPVSLGTSNALNHLTYLNSSAAKQINAVAVGNNGTCFATINMQSWFPVTLPTTDDIISITSYDNVLVCGTDNGITLKSTNRGTNWVTSSSGITTNIYDLVFISPTVVIGASENGVMLRSINAGNSWLIVNTPLKNDIYALDFGSGTFGIAVGGETEIYTTNSGKTWVQLLSIASANITQKEPVKLNQNYPNPFNPSTVINYTINDNSNISIKIYDLTGREVRTLENSFRNAGTYSVIFNAENLSSGTYFYVLRVNNGSKVTTKTMRMILTK